MYDPLIIFDYQHYKVVTLNFQMDRCVGSYDFVNVILGEVFRGRVQHRPRGPDFNHSALLPYAASWACRSRSL